MYFDYFQVSSLVRIKKKKKKKKKKKRKKENGLIYYYYYQKYAPSVHMCSSFNVIRYYIKLERLMKLNKNTQKDYLFLFDDYFWFLQKICT